MGGRPRTHVLIGTSSHACAQITGEKLGAHGVELTRSRTNGTVSPQRRTRHLSRTLPEVRAAHGKDGRGDATRPHDGGRHRVAVTGVIVLAHSPVQGSPRPRRVC